MDSLKSSAAAASESAASDQIIFKVNKQLVGSDFLKFFKDEVFCDVAVNTDDGKRIPVHRMVLNEVSDYFKAMFSTELREGGQREISIKKVDGDILYQLIEYCYSGEIAINNANVEELSQTATMLQFTGVVQNCTEFYRNKLNASNCLGVRAMADLHNMKQLKEAAHDFVLNHFKEVSKSDDFLLLDKEELSMVLQDDDLLVPHEEDVFIAVMDWVKHDLHGRKQLFESLLDYVQLTRIEGSFLWDEAHKYSLDIGYPELLQLIATRRSFDKQNKVSRFSKFKFHVVHDNSDNSNISIGAYCQRQNKWTEVKTIDLEIEGFAVVYHDGKFIIIGGANHDGDELNTVKSIDMNTFEVVDLPPMISARERPSVQLFNDSIYVFGGDSNLRTVEKFDFAKQEWTFVAPMCIVDRQDAAHAVFAGRLYAIGGGINYRSYLDSVECYDPTTNTWQMVAPMRTARKQCAACVACSFIYVFGGCDKKKTLQSVERYDPRENVWTQLEFGLSVPRRFNTPSPAYSDGNWVYLASGARCFSRINVVTGENFDLEDLPKHSYVCSLAKC